MQIAVFGGSFDPIHIAHVAIVETALEKLNIDKLIIVPTYLNPFKNSFYFEPEIRLKLLRKVFQKYRNIEISNFEIAQKKVTYSFDTINYLKELYKPSKIYFILGEDNLKNLDKWYKINDLRNMVEFVVVTRKAYKSIEAKEFKILDVDIDISSTSLREEINMKYIPSEIQNDILNLTRGKSF